jgi:hypothetical protein
MNVKRACEALPHGPFGLSMMINTWNLFLKRRMEMDCGKVA